MPMSGHSTNPAKVGASPPATPAQSQTRRLDVFLPSSAAEPQPHETPEEEDYLTSLGLGPGAAESEQPVVSRGGGARGPAAAQTGATAAAHPLYQNAARGDDQVPLKRRFPRFGASECQDPSTPASATSDAGKGGTSTGPLSDLAGLPGPAVRKDANFLSSYSHNYGKREGGKTWWTAK